MSFTRRRYMFDAAHRVAIEDHWWNTLHGHTFRVTIDLIFQPYDEVELTRYAALIGTWIETTLNRACILDQADEHLAEALYAINSKTVLLDCAPTSANIAEAIKKAVGEIAGAERVGRVQVSGEYLPP